MISEAEISLALTTRLAETPGLPDIVWENDDSPNPARPYIYAQMVRVSTVDRSLSGGHAVHNGYLMVTIINDLDQYATASERIADTIRARFRKGERMPITGGTVLIDQPVTLLPAFRDGPDWRTPVRIDYRTE